MRGQSPPVMHEPLDPLEPKDGFAALVDYRLTVWEPDRAEVELTVEAKHRNRSGRLHGGVVTTLIDAASGLAGTYCAVPGNVRRAVTLSLTTQFVGAGAVGMHLVAEARKVGGGRQIFFTQCEVRDRDGHLVGKGEGVFRYRSTSATPEGEPI